MERLPKTPDLRPAQRGPGSHSPGATAARRARRATWSPAVDRHGSGSSASAAARLISGLMTWKPLACSTTAESISNTSPLTVNLAMTHIFRAHKKKCIYFYFPLNFTQPTRTTRRTYLQNLPRTATTIRLEIKSESCVQCTAPRVCASRSVYSMHGSTPGAGWGAEKRDAPGACGTGWRARGAAWTPRQRVFALPTLLVFVAVPVEHRDRRGCRVSWKPTAGSPSRGCPSGLFARSPGLTWIPSRTNDDAHHRHLQACRGSGSCAHENRKRRQRGASAHIERVRWRRLRVL